MFPCPVGTRGVSAGTTYPVWAPFLLRWVALWGPRLTRFNSFLKSPDHAPIPQGSQKRALLF
jgi:hypothetical protein